jgi:AbrB family looped-hinge helix DNA binding protein
MKTHTAVLSSKGQVTIPKEVREALAVGTGDSVDFRVRDDGVVELGRRPALASLLLGRLARFAAAAGGDERDDAVGHAVERDGR